MGVPREMGFEDGRLSRLIWEEQVAGQAVEGGVQMSQMSGRSGQRGHNCTAVPSTKRPGWRKGDIRRM